MPDLDERRPERPAGEFARLAEFAQRGSVLATPTQIRVLGLRRLRRRRVCQAVLGTGALAAVVFLGAGFVQNGSGVDPSAARPIQLPSRLAPAGAAPSAAASAKSVQYTLPEMVSASSANAVVAQLQHAGYAHVTRRSVASDSVPQGDAVDIEDGQGHSLLGRTVSLGTPLIVVVSAGPAH